MKLLFTRIAIVLLITMPACAVTAQSVAINSDGSLADPNAILDLKATNKGLLIPRINTAARIAIPNTKGLLVFDITTNSFWYNTGTAWQELQAGWSLTGNSGTGSGQFIGTTDFVPLTIKVNNQLSGYISPDGNNANTFLGYSAGISNTAGTYNAALGYLAYNHNSTGNFSTAIGAGSLNHNTSGTSNTGIGYAALFTSISSDHNVAVGTSCMFFNTTGHDNTAMGYTSMINNTTGADNVAIGDGALVTNQTGSNNTVVGTNANIAIDGLTNATAIGNSAVVDASNKVRIGNSAVTVIEGQVPFTTPSDGRYKYNIQEDVKGLDFILQLRPVTYQFDVKRFDAQVSNSQSHTDLYQQAAYDEAAKIRRTGFIAQEVEKAATTSGYDFSGIIKPKKATDHYSLSYESFVVPLVKAVQEQQQTIDIQNKKIDDLQQQLNELKKLIQRSN